MTSAIFRALGSLFSAFVPPSIELGLNTHSRSPRCRGLAGGPRSLRRALLAAVVGLALSGHAASAATVVVNSTSDVTANDGKTTLREAFAAAQNGDTIEFASSLFSGATPTKIKLGAALVLTKSVTVVGPGDFANSGNPKLQIEGSGSHRVLQIKSPAVVVMAGVGLKGGRAWGGGGVLIEEGATATFQGCDFTENRATDSNSNQGGAIFNRGTLTLDQCLIKGNKATDGGGVASQGRLTIVRSLVEDNYAKEHGGGIYVRNAALQIESSTISGNHGGEGGGVAFAAFGATTQRATITAATFADNSSSSKAGALYVEGSAALATVGGSLFARNTLVKCDDHDDDDDDHDHDWRRRSNVAHDLGTTSGGKIVSADYNLFVKPGMTLSPWGPNDLIGADPKISDLAWNGGRTRTHAIAANSSPALNRGNPAFTGSLVKTDQRSFPRVATQGSRADIGAFELGSPIALNLIGGTTLTVPLGTAFSDPGVSLNAPAGTVLTQTVNGVLGGQVNTLCPGSYVIVYTATIGSASASVSRTVNVTESISLVAPAKVTRNIEIATGKANVNLATVVSVTGLPVNVNVPLTYSVAVPSVGYNQTGLAALPTLSFGQVGVYPVTVKAFSPCGGEVGAVAFQVVIDPGNVAWPLAIELDSKLLPAGNRLIGSIQHKLERAGESRWYRFRGKPGSRIEVSLTQLPANFDVVVYGDINAAYNSLLGLINSTPADKTLALLGAEFAPEAYAPEAYSPEAYAPEAYAPEAYAPEAYAPEAYAPEAYSPEAYAPEAYAPEAYAPEAYAPEAYAPEAYAPEAYAPEAYASAQQRSLIAFSASAGTASEGVRFNTYSSTGEFYIRVRGQNGVFSTDAPFTLTLAIQQDLCAGLADFNVTPATIATAVAGSPTSLILWDSARIAGTAAEKAALGTSLASFATVANGLVVDLNNDTRIRALNQQSDANPFCPVAKNLVADAIRNLIQAYRKVEPTIADITLVGNDDVIPFFRTNDESLLASESNYFPPVKDETQSQSSLRYSQVLTQDRYGSSVQVVLATGPYDLPEIPTGRLVETAAEVTQYVIAYRALFDGSVSTGGVLPTPRSAFVAGYDFLADSAAAMRDDFAAGLGAGGIVNSLITPGDQPPAFGWTASQLRTAFLGSRHDFAYLAAHFSTGRLLAADYATRFSAREVAESPLNLAYALILSAGCHSGYSTVDNHALPLLTDQPDWAQALAQKRAMWIAGTGYQYGDTDFIEYTERLLLEVARALRTGSGSIAIGRALVDAKRLYLMDTAIMRGIHEKTLLQVVLYGLPMVKVNLPGTRINPTAPAVDVATTAPVATGPGASQGLRTGNLSFNPLLTRVDRTLDVVGTDTTIVASYFRGSDGQVSLPGEPVRPLKSFNVGRPEGFVRGIGFRGGLYTDLSSFVPFTGAPATETRGVHGSFSTSVFYPILPWNLNRIGAVAAANGVSELNTFPAQFLSDGPSATTGTLRRYDQMQFTVFYCPTATEAALANPPAINLVASTASATAITFAIDAAANVPAGVQEVWITYTGLPGSPHYGKWQSLSLTGPANATGIGTWTGTLPLNGANPALIRFIVQAANGFGAVAASTNFGRYFISGNSTLDGVGVLSTPTTVTLDAGVPSNALYRATIPLSARLAAGGAGLAGKRVQFRLGSAVESAVTDTNGVATTTLLVNVQPGPYALEAEFAGDATYDNASASRPFTVTKMPTALTLTRTDAQNTGIANYVATLKAQDGTPLKERTLVIIIDRNGVKTAQAEITDGAGQVRVPSINRSTNATVVYSISAFFAQSVALPDASVAVLSDPLYVGTSATATFGFGAVGQQ